MVRPITIRQLLSHSSGLSYETTPADVSPGMSGPYISPEENLRRLAKAPLVIRDEHMDQLVDAVAAAARR